VKKFAKQSGAQKSQNKLNKAHKNRKSGQMIAKPSGTHVAKQGEPLGGPGQPHQKAAEQARAPGCAARRARRQPEQCQGGQRQQAADHDQQVAQGLRLGDYPVKKIVNLNFYIINIKN
jgi:hypothetical protein